MPDAATFAALRLRAARVGYLGAADSPVRVRVATGTRTTVAAGGAFVPDHTGDLTINVTPAGRRSSLGLPACAVDRAGRLSEPVACPDADASVRLSLTPVRKAAGSRRGGGVATLRPSVSGRRVSALTSLFKEAVLSQHQRLHGTPSAVLHGHGFNEKGYEIARYLALPDVGYERSRGRVHGLALWLPPGCEATAHRMARDAAVAIRRLTGRGVDVAVAPLDDEPRPFAAHPDRWLRPSFGWATAVPAIHERRRRLDLAEAARWCEHEGLPPPVAFRSARAPLTPGAIDLAPVEVNRPGRPALPYSHLELWFDHAIPGPVVVGAGRQRGFGLCVPLDGRA